MTRINLLDHGFIRLVDRAGSDLSIVRAARVSYDAAWRAGEDEANDHRLMRRLWTAGRKNNVFASPCHSTPFESVVVTFEVMAPIFVFRQWHRHRTQSYNELSARYRELPEVFYTPDAAQIGMQAAKNKQGRELRIDPEVLGLRNVELTQYRKQCATAFATYRELLEAGWPRELARCVLPFSTYSHMFATANLKNWLNFCSLRCDEHVQHEIRVYSDAIINLLEPIVPETVALWREGVVGLERAANT